MSKVFTSGSGANYYRIMCRNKEQTEAFAEAIYCYQVLSDARAWVQTYNGDSYFCEASAIICNPEIIRDVNGAGICKIRLGETVHDADF